MDTGAGAGAGAGDDGIKGHNGGRLRGDGAGNGDTEGDRGQGNVNDCENESIVNPQSIYHLHLFQGENTRSICHNVSLPVVGDAVFCKHCYLRGPCFTSFF